MKSIGSLRDGDRVEGQFLVASCNKCLSNAGKNYLNIVFQDSTGVINAKKWDLDEGDEKLLAGGRIVSVSGDVLEYKGALQLKVLSVRDLDQSLVDVTRFALPCPVDPKILEEKLAKYLDSLKEGEGKTLVKALIMENYKAYTTHPAAVRNHHNCLSGLLYHSLYMADVAEALCTMYPTLDRDLLIEGCLIHDIGKIKELSGPVATKYTEEGRLVGHLCIGEGMILNKAEELDLHGEDILMLRHMVLSHHDHPEFGAAVRPLTREAFALSHIDDFDAKMNIIDKALDGVEEGEWSQRIISMDERFFYNHKKAK